MLRKISRATSESRFAAMFGDIGRLRSSVFDLRTLNQTTEPFLELTSSDPVKPGMTITGGLPWAKIENPRAPKRRTETANRRINLFSFKSTYRCIRYYD